MPLDIEGLPHGVGLAPPVAPPVAPLGAPLGAPLVAEPAAPPRDGSDDRLPFLAFVEGDGVEAALRGGLVEHADRVEVRRGDIRTAARALQKSPSPRVLLVEIPEESNAFEMLDDLARVCAPDTRVMAIGQRTDIGFYRELTQGMGVTEYLHTPVTRETVARLLGPHVAGAAAQRMTERGGKVVAILGARGGVGGTTIAVSLASFLSEYTHGHVSLLDLHLQGGTTAMMLGVRPSSGLRVALEDPERADQLFLERSSIPIGDRFRLIAAEEPMQAAPEPTAPGVERVLSLLRRKFNHVVVDVPVPTPAAMRVLLSEAAQRVVVMGPDLASLRDAVALRAMLEERAGPARSLTVLNRNGISGSLKMPLLQEGLCGKPDVVIPEIPQVSKAAMVGEPPLRASAVFRKSIEALAIEVSGVGPSAAGKERRLRLPWSIKR